MNRPDHPYRCGHCAQPHDERLHFCIRCGRFGVSVPAARRPAEDLWKGDLVVSARELRRPSRSTPLTPYPVQVSHPFCGIAYGNPGSGKSTLLARIADAFPGVALLLALEEGLGDAVRMRLARLEIHREDFLVATISDLLTLDNLIVERNVGLLVIDSLTASTLQPRDLLALVRDRGISVLASMQVNAEGRPSGTLTMPHLCDVIIRVEGGRWFTEKNRFGKLVFGEVL